MKLSLQENNSFYDISLKQITFFSYNRYQKGNLCDLNG